MKMHEWLEDPLKEDRPNTYNIVIRPQPTCRAVEVARALMNCSSTATVPGRTKIIVTDVFLDLVRARANRKNEVQGYEHNVEALVTAVEEPFQ